MKKTVLIMSIIAIFGFCAFLIFNYTKQNNSITEPIQTEPIAVQKEIKTAKTEPLPLKEIKRDTWCITFQLVWNDLMDTLLDGNQ